MQLTRRQFIAAASTWALSQAAGIKRPWLARALAQSAVSLDSVPIYLTFDDGVETDLAEGKKGPTLDVLDILDVRGILATFFVHGRNTGLAEGGVLARMLRTGHRVGNHLFQQGGTTVGDQPTPLFLAKQYLDTEIRIRDVLAPYPDALDFYLSADHPHLFRRPGGGYDDPRGNLFLLPDSGYWELFRHDPYLAGYQHTLSWLQGVYDYSGWHISPLPMWATVSTPEEVVWWALHSAKGLEAFLHPIAESPQRATSRGAIDGLIILLHDPDLRVVNALPLLLDALDERGATYHVLPRPVDQPNRYTVGIGRPPEIVELSSVVADTLPIP